MRQGHPDPLEQRVDTAGGRAAAPGGLDAEEDAAADVRIDHAAQVVDGAVGRHRGARRRSRSRSGSTGGASADALSEQLEALSPSTRPRRPLEGLEQRGAVDAARPSTAARAPSRAASSNRPSASYERHQDVARFLEVRARARASVSASRSPLRAAREVRAPSTTPMLTRSDSGSSSRADQGLLERLVVAGRPWRGTARRWRARRASFGLSRIAVVNCVRAAAQSQPPEQAARARAMTCASARSGSSASACSAAARARGKPLGRHDVAVVRHRAVASPRPAIGRRVQSGRARSPARSARAPGGSRRATSCSSDSGRAGTPGTPRRLTVVALPQLLLLLAGQLQPQRFGDLPGDLLLHGEQVADVVWRNRSPQSCDSLAVSTSSAWMFSTSPCCTTRPVRMVRAFSARPTVAGSACRPL